MNPATLRRSIACTFATAFCLAASAALAAENSPTSNEVAALKADLAHAEEKLEMVLRSYTLATQENDALKAQAAQAAAAREAAVAEAAAAAARAKEAEVALAQVSKEMAAVRSATAPREAENARLREILRQTQDTNAALTAENARLKTEIGIAKPSPAGSYVPAPKSKP